MDQGLVVKGVISCFDNTPVPKLSLSHRLFRYAMRSVYQCKRNQPIRLLNRISAIEHVCQLQKNNGCWHLSQATLDYISDQEVDLVISFSVHDISNDLTQQTKLGLIRYAVSKNELDPFITSAIDALLHAKKTTSIGIYQKASNQVACLSQAQVSISPHNHALTFNSILAHATLLLPKAVFISYHNPNYRIHHQASEQAEQHPLLQLLVLSAKRTYHRIAGKLIGAFSSNRWTVCRTKSPLTYSGHQAITAEHSYLIPKDMVFVADSIVLNEDTILCEGLEIKTNKGVLLSIKDGQFARLDTTGHHLSKEHLSYPFVFRDKGKTYLVPEMSSTGAQCIYPIDPQTLDIGTGITLKGLEHERLADATILFDKGTYWLFAGKAGLTVNSVLYLWHSEQLEGPYLPHPLNPICIDCDGGRQAGPIHEHNGKYYRFGQNNTKLYGNGVVVFEIAELNFNNYQEHRVSTIKSQHHNGPHTIDFQGEDIIFDHYIRAFDKLAWLRKLK
jgi:hypothetical protein